MSAMVRKILFTLQYRKSFSSLMFFNKTLRLSHCWRIWVWTSYA